jgi:hypothetical protein
MLIFSVCGKFLENNHLKERGDWRIILIWILLNLVVGRDFGASGSGLHPIALFVCGIEPSGSTRFRIYRFL